MDEQKPQAPQESDSQNIPVRSYESLSRESDNTPTPTTPLVIPKKKSGAKKWLLWGLVVILLAGLSMFAYWQWSEAKSAQDELSSTQDQLKASQAQVKKLAAADDTEETTVKTPSDKELVTTQAETYLASQVDNKFVVKVVKVQGDFAQVSAQLPTSTEGGKTIILKKAKDAWTVLYGGVTNSVTAENKAYLVKEFAVPESLIN